MQYYVIIIQFKGGGVMIRSNSYLRFYMVEMIVNSMADEQSILDKLVKRQN